MSMQTALWLAMLAGVVAIVYGVFIGRAGSSRSRAGNARMQEIAAAIQAGRQGLPEPPVLDHRHRRRRAVRRARIRAQLGTRQSASPSARSSRASPATSA